LIITGTQRAEAGGDDERGKVPTIDAILSAFIRRQQ